MEDQRVMIGGGGKLWCKNSKRGFTVRLTGNEREEKRGEGGGWKVMK